MIEIPPYPLCWPDNMPRTPEHRRQYSRFKTTLAGAIKNVEGALSRFGDDSGKKVSNIVATTNIIGISLGEKKKIDPGVAVWFDWDGVMRCIAVDRYPKTEDNLQAIYHIIEARRTEVRHGGLVIAQTAFRGFTALPAPPSDDWQKVLGLRDINTKQDINAAYRKLAAEAHPDRPGGSQEAMQRLNKARDEALKALGE